MCNWLAAWLCCLCLCGSGSIIVHRSDALEILGVFPTRAASHAHLGRKLMQGLVDAGHNVTLISPVARRPGDGFTVVQVDEYRDGGTSKSKLYIVSFALYPITSL